MESTGYRDRKSREIFDGDICRIVFWHNPKKKPVIGIVRPYEWRHNRFAIFPKKGLPYSCMYKTGGLSGNTFAVEVIGNVRIHPQLLK